MFRSLMTKTRFRPSLITSGPKITSSTFTNTSMSAQTLNADTISKITEKEKEITKSENPVKGGPTAQAQKHVGESITDNVGNIAQGEKKITGQDSQVQGGPAAAAQSMATNAATNGTSTSSTAPTGQSAAGTGKLDSQTLSNITAAEKSITGEDRAVKGGPTAQAQKHANESITSEALHDITEGEKKITGGDRVKGGPTSTAQSELAKSRS